MTDLHRETETLTPWRRVFAKFGMSQRALGRALGRDGAKINRAIKDERGLINGADQERILRAAKERGVSLKSGDLVPSVDE